MSKKIGNLEEFMDYPCKVLKIIQIDNEGEFFVIQDPFNDKHLVTTEFYKDYNILPNCTVKMYVDKINCKGKIFWEPDHPYYKLNQVYTFNFVRKDQLLDKNGLLFKAFIVKDYKDRECFVTVNDNSWETAGNLQTVECLVTRVKKSQPILQLVNKS